MGRVIDKERVKEIIQMHYYNKSLTELAEMCDVTSSTIHNYRKELGLPPKERNIFVHKDAILTPHPLVETVTPVMTNYKKVKLKVLKSR